MKALLTSLAICYFITFTAAVIDCPDKNTQCALHAQCTFTGGKFICICQTGFTGDGKECHDIDECADRTDNCHNQATCANTDGSFTCTCKTGFTGNGIDCVDIDECKDGLLSCHPNADCKNTRGSAECLCQPGYAGDGQNCTDLCNTCLPGSETCGQDSSGVKACICNSGYQLDPATGHCVDIDECASGYPPKCSTRGYCFNTQGSVTCKCKDGHVGDGVDCLHKDFFKKFKDLNELQLG